MYLHEYQAKRELSRFGVNVLPFEVVGSLEEVEKKIGDGMQEAIVKIQVHAGGRGKAGGVKRAKNRGFCGDGTDAVCTGASSSLDLFGFVSAFLQH